MIVGEKMALIKQEKLNEVLEKANIVDIIGNYVPLQKKGSDYVGICPFHDDHSPSMHVSTKLNIFKCFVCNTGGNVFSFVSKFDNISFIEAVKKVSELAGVDLEIKGTFKTERRFKEEYELMELSSKYYQNYLNTKEGLEAKEYLIQRGINEDIIKEYKIGLSPVNNDLKDFLENKKINLELAFKVGLLNKSGINYYDTFSGRIMIPLQDMYGNLCGYTARCYKDTSENKYINSKETIIYRKSDILFNYYNAKELARKERELIIVEGNMDAILLSSYGIKNVCALMGVVLSKNQIEAIKKLNSKIILILDSDNAGKLATINIGDELFKNNIDLYVVRLSGAKDPDEYIRAFGKEALLDNIKHATKYLDFKIETLKEEKDLNNLKDFTDYIKEVIILLGNISELEREAIIAKLCKEYNIDPNIIRQNIKITQPVIKEQKTISKKRKTKYEKAVSSLIYAMLLNKNYYKIYTKQLGYLENKVESDTAISIGGYIKKHGDINIADFISYVSEYEQITNFVTNVISENTADFIEEKEFCDILDIVSKCMEEKEIKRLRKEIIEEKDIDKKIKLVEKLAVLKKGSDNNERN